MTAPTLGGSSGVGTAADEDRRRIAPGHQNVGEKIVVETPAYAVVRLAELGESGWAGADPAAAASVAHGSQELSAVGTRNERRAPAIVP